MKFTVFAVILILAQMAVPKGLILYAGAISECGATTTGCVWWEANNVATTIFSNVLVEIKDIGQANKDKFNATLAKYPRLKVIVGYYPSDATAAASLAEADVLAETKKMIAAYPGATGIAFQYITAAKLVSSAAAIKTAGMKLFVESVTIDTVTLPDAIWYPEITAAIEDIANNAIAVPDYPCYLDIYGTSALFAANLDKITTLDVDYVDVYAADAGIGEYTTADLKVVADYLHTQVTCDKSCATCLGSTSKDCLTCTDAKLKLNTATFTCGASWVSAIVGVAFLLLVL